MPVEFSAARLKMPADRFLGGCRSNLLTANRSLRAASLRFKITFFTIVLLTTTSLILCLTTVHIANRYIQGEIVKRGSAVGRSIAASAGYSMLSNDVLGLDNLVFQAKAANRDMAYAVVVDRRLRMIVDSELPGARGGVRSSTGRFLAQEDDGTVVRELTGPAGEIFEISCPVLFMRQRLGSVVIGMNRSVLAEARRSVAARLFQAFGLIVTLGILASSLLASFLMRPIRELSAGVNEMKKGSAGGALRIYSRDELGRLTADFNEMSARIAEQQAGLRRYAGDLEEAYVSIVKVVAAAIDARDAYTHGHSARVARLSRLIGERLGLPSGDLEDLEIACLFHDVGKIQTPDAILLKPTMLEGRESLEMMRHVEHGTAILSRAPLLIKYIPSTRHHHEWHNGRGYPDGLVGEDIPLYAAIIAIADSFDAMTTDRPYRKARATRDALDEIARKSGTQFRPDLVAIFLDCMKEETPAECGVSEAAVPEPEMVP